MKEVPMKTIAKTLFALSALAIASHAAAQVTLYENERFDGRSVTTQSRLNHTRNTALDDRASSAIVTGQRWLVCEEARYRGRCVVLRPGQYPMLSAMGLNEPISSARPIPADARVAEADYAPMPTVARDFRRRDRERLFDADVTTVRAVVGTPAQRCWIEREQVAANPTSGVNVPAAAVGAIIGGILGHQVGGGSGQKIATVGGAVGGAALGAQYGRADTPQYASTQDVRRCDNNPAQATPAYWDVVYQFRGQEHRVQMANPPGRTIVVNSRGEPRA
jgi:uncharacterized protein YcfJ